MFELGRVERGALAGSAIAAFLAALAVAPSRAGNAAASLPAAEAPLHVRSLPSDVPVARDPFGPDVDPLPSPAVPALPKLIPLPPNAGAGVFPFAAGPASPRVLAVVAGPQPRALVEDAGRSRMVGPGDRFAGRRVVQIDAGGLTLDDGRRISIETEHQP